MKRRVRGSGSIYVPSGRRLLYIKLPVTGERVATGLPDTKENRQKLQDIIDTAYLEHKLKGVNPFENLKKTSITIGDAFLEFIETHASSKTARTVDWYNQSYKRLLAPYSSEIATTNTITESLRKSIVQHSIRSVSIKTYIRGINVFTNWCEHRGYITDKIDTEILVKELVRVEPKPIPSEYTEQEKNQILEYFREHDNDMYYMIQLMFDVGLRWHEAASLRAEHIKNDSIVIESKDHRKFDIVPLDITLANRLKELVTDGYLFKYHKADKNTYRANVRKLDRAFRAIGIEKKSRAFHEMRKTFISTICRKEIPLDVAAKLARCRVDVIMEHYRVFNLNELQEAVK